MTALTGALGVLRRHWRAAYLTAVAITLVNTVPDVGRKVLVWDDPSTTHYLLVGIVGVLTALLAQLWLTGALSALPASGAVRVRGALQRGTRIAWTAVRTAPLSVLAGVLAGGAVSAVLTLPASVAALGLDRLLGPLDSPAVGAFAVAAVSDVVASAVTLPFLSLVLITVSSGKPWVGSDRP